jgi:uncharacterized protein (DUF2236 family)
MSRARSVYFRDVGLPAVDFTQPAGEPALTPAGSISWQVFKNPVALFAGGVAAVILELAEPRVRTGVWEHTTFRTDPIARMERTGLAAMVTVYGAQSIAEKMVAGVRGMHARIRGKTPTGESYQANDPELLDWVHVTAAFGFLEAYAAFVRSVGDAAAIASTPRACRGRLYGAVGAPASLAEQRARFEAMRPKLERSDIVFEFLDVMQRAPIAPSPMGPLQWMLVRAGSRSCRAGRARSWAWTTATAWPGGSERSSSVLGAAADRIPFPGSPACRPAGGSGFRRPISTACSERPARNQPSG